MAKNYVTIPEYSKMIGYNEQYIRRVIAKRIITKKALKKKGKRWLVNPEQADIDRDKNLAPENRKKLKTKPTDQEKETVSKKAGTAHLDYAECRRLNEQYKAGLRKLEYDQKSGSLISADKVEQDYFNIGRTIRDSLLSIPNRIGAILAAEDDQLKVANILKTEIIQALEILSK